MENRHIHGSDDLKPRNMTNEHFNALPEKDKKVILDLLSVRDYVQSRMVGAPEWDIENFQCWTLNALGHFISMAENGDVEAYRAIWNDAVPDHLRI